VHHNSGKACMNLRVFVNMGSKYVVGKWDKTKFWHDVWLGECPLRIRFHKLFSICQQQKWEVARVLRDGEINLSFRRNFEEEILE
jgi:hypothetical protein